MANQEHTWDNCSSHEQTGMVPSGTQGNDVPGEQGGNEYSMSHQRQTWDYLSSHEQAISIPLGAQGNVVRHEQTGMVPFGTQRNYLPGEQRENEYSMSHQQQPWEYLSSHEVTGSTPLEAQGIYMTMGSRGNQYSMADQQQTQGYNARHEQGGMIPFGSQGNYVPTEPGQNQYSIPYQHHTPGFIAGGEQVGMIPLGDQASYLPMESGGNQHSISLTYQHEDRFIGPSTDESTMLPHEYFPSQINEAGNRGRSYGLGLGQYLDNRDSVVMEESHLQGSVAHGEVFSNQTRDFTDEHGGALPMRFGKPGNNTPREPRGHQQTYAIEDQYGRGLVSSFDDNLRNFPILDIQTVGTENEYRGMYDKSHFNDEYIPRDFHTMEGSEMGGNAYGQHNEGNSLRMESTEPQRKESSVDDEFEFILDYISKKEPSVMETNRYSVAPEFDLYDDNIREGTLITEERQIESTAPHLPQDEFKLIAPLKNPTRVFTTNHESEPTLKSNTYDRMGLRNYSDSDSVIRTANNNNEDAQLEMAEPIRSRLSEEQINQFKQQQIETGLPEPIINEMIDYYRSLNNEYRILQLERIQIDRQKCMLIEEDNLKIEKIKQSTIVAHERERAPILEQGVKRRDQLEQEDDEQGMQTIINKMFTKAQATYMRAAKRIKQSHLYRLRKLFNEEITEKPEQIIQLESIYADGMQEIKEKYPRNKNSIKYNSEMSKLFGKHVWRVLKEWKQHFKIKEPVPTRYRGSRNKSALMDAEMIGQGSYNPTTMISENVASQEEIDVDEQVNESRDRIIDSFCRNQRSHALPEPIIQSLATFYKELYNKKEQMNQEWDAAVKQYDEAKQSDQLKAAKQILRKRKKHISNLQDKYARTFVGLFDKHHASQRPDLIVIEDERYQKCIEEESNNFLEMKKFKDKHSASKIHNESTNAMRRSHVKELEKRWKTHYQIEYPFENSSNPEQIEQTGTQGNMPADNNECIGNKKGKASKTGILKTVEDKTKPTDKDIDKLASRIAKHTKQQNNKPNKLKKTHTIGKGTSDQTRLKADQMVKAGKKRKADQIQQVQVSSQAQENVWKRKYEYHEKSKKTESKQWRQKAEKEQQRKEADSKPEQKSNKANRVRGEERDEPREENNRKAASHRQVETVKDDRDANWKKVVNEYERKHC